MGSISLESDNDGLFGDTLIRQSYVFGGVACLVMILVVGVFWVYLPPRVPLFFSRAWGEDRLAHKGLLFMLPGIGLVVNCMNIIISQVIGDVDVLVTRSLAVGAGVVSLMLCISVFGIVRSVI